MKVLIVKIGAVGDTVMALSMLEAVDRQWPGAKVTWVCGTTVGPLVRAVGRVDEIVVLDDRKLLKGGVLGALSVLIPLWLRFLGRAFDLILTGHSDPRYRLLSLTARGRIHRSFGKGRGGPVPGRWHADEYVLLVTGIERPEAPRARIPHLQLPLPQELQSQLPPGGKPWVALAPGGAKNLLRDDTLRRWPLEHYVSLAGLLLKDGFPVVLTGSPSDEWVRESFKKLSVTDLVGKTSLTDLAALYGRCGLLVTHDSGPLHLGLLAGVPTVSLFGPTNPSEKVREDEKNVVLWGGKELACRPCYDGKNYAPCTNNLCLKAVSVEAVYGQAMRLLGKG